MQIFLVERYSVLLSLLTIDLVPGVLAETIISVRILGIRLDLVNLLMELNRRKLLLSVMRKVREPKAEWIGFATAKALCERGQFN